MLNFCWLYKNVYVKLEEPEDLIHDEDVDYDEAVDYDDYFEPCPEEDDEFEEDPNLVVGGSKTINTGNIGIGITTTNGNNLITGNTGNITVTSTPGNTVIAPPEFIKVSLVATPPPTDMSHLYTEVHYNFIKDLVNQHYDSCKFRTFSLDDMKGERLVRFEISALKRDKTIIKGCFECEYSFFDNVDYEKELTQEVVSIVGHINLEATGDHLMNTLMGKRKGAIPPAGKYPYTIYI